MATEHHDLPPQSEPTRLKASFRWTRLDSYIFSEINFPFLMAMLVYNGIFFIKTFGSVSELSSGQFEIPFRLFMMYFMSEIPDILYLTTALSFLFGSLAAIGRMSGDSEIIAPQSAGIGFLRLGVPVIAYGAMLSCMLFALTNWVGPKLNQIWQKEYRTFLEGALPNIDTGVINPMGDDAILYVNSVQDGKLANLLFINHGKDKDEILLADRAHLYSNRALRLFDALRVQLPLDGEHGPEILRAEQWERAIPLPQNFDPRQLKGASKHMMYTPELYRALADAGDQRLVLENEFYNRILSPLVCIVFALFAVPLAAKHSRTKAGSGFGMSLFIIAVYFTLVKLGRDASHVGDLPPMLGVGLPPLIFFVLGVILQVGKDRWWSRHWKGIRDRISFDPRKWIPQSEERKAVEAVREEREEEDGPGHIHTILFPSKLDIHVIRSFFSILILVQVSLLLMFLLIEYTQISKFVNQNSIDVMTVVRYMVYKVPEMLDLSLFFCLLVTTLILLAVMSKNLEVIVVRAGGGSLQRLCLPLLLIGILASMISYYVENSFLPHTNRMAITLRNKIKDKNDVLFARDVWLKTANGDVLNYSYFDPKTNRLVGVHRYSIGSEGGVVERGRYPSLIYRNGWQTDQPGRTWRFAVAENGKVKADPHTVASGTPFQLELDPADLSQTKRRVSEFSIDELKDYLKYLKGLGYSETHYQTALYAKYAQPLIPLIMILLAIPLGFQFGRRGTFFGVGMGLVAGLLFVGLVELMKKFGDAGMIHPLAAGWSVVVLFGVGALYRFINLE